MSSIQLSARESARKHGAGALTWFFPDGDLPWPDTYGPFQGHESLLIMNVSQHTAHIHVDIYWTDREPFIGIRIDVEAERIACLHPPYGQFEDGTAPEIPVRTQYALGVRSDVPVICQFGRIECRPSFGMYTTMGWSGGSVQSRE
jgi:hypothetical protein